MDMFAIPVEFIDIVEFIPIVEFIVIVEFIIVELLPVVLSYS